MGPHPIKGTDAMNEEIKLIRSTEGVVFSPDFKTLHCEQDHKLITLEVETQTLIKQYPHHGFIQVAGTNPAGDRVYVRDWDFAKVIIIDTVAQTETLGYEAGMQTTGMAISTDGHQLYILTAESNASFLSVVDSRTQTLVKKIKVGGFPVTIGVNPANSLVYVCCAYQLDGGVYVVDPVTEKVIHIPMKIGIPTGLAFNPDKHFAYVSNAEGTITAIDTINHGIRGVFPTGGKPTKMAVSNCDNWLYALNNNSGAIHVFEAEKMTLDHTITTSKSDLRAITTQKSNGALWVGYYA
jgi:DNA-binding beta-propeller fold protein YncE